MSAVRPALVDKALDRTFLVQRRQALMLELAAIEDYLGLPRTYLRKRERTVEKDREIREAKRATVLSNNDVN